MNEQPSPETESLVIHKNTCQLTDADATTPSASHNPAGIPLVQPPPAVDINRQATRQRSRSLYRQLSSEQQIILLRWLREHSLAEVQRLVAAPPPEGFGIRTHITTLHRLRVAQRSVPAAARIIDMLDSVEDIERATDLNQLRRVKLIVENLLHEHALHLAHESPSSENLWRTLRYIEKLSALEHRRQKLVLEREKLLRCHDASPKHHRVDLNILKTNSAQG